MSAARRLLERARQSPANMRFNDLCRLAEAAGFTLRTPGGTSHRIYTHPRLTEIINLQPRNGKAKPYQVRQVVSLIDEHDLLPEDDADEDEHGQD